VALAPEDLDLLIRANGILGDTGMDDAAREQALLGLAQPQIEQPEQPGLIDSPDALAAASPQLSPDQQAIASQIEAMSAVEPAHAPPAAAPTVDQFPGVGQSIDSDGTPEIGSVDPSSATFRRGVGEGEGEGEGPMRPADPLTERLGQIDALPGARFAQVRDPGFVTQQRNVQRTEGGKLSDHDLERIETGEQAALGNQIEAEQRKLELQRETGQLQGELEAAQAQRRIELQERESQRQDALAEKERSIASLTEEIALQSKIDPNSWWENKSTGDKILTGLAVFLGTLGSSITGDPNTAYEEMKRQMQADLDAQKSNADLSQRRLQNQLTLYDMARERATDEREADLLAEEAAQGQMVAMLDGFRREASQPAEQAALDAMLSQAQADLAEKQAIRRAHNSDQVAISEAQRYDSGVARVGGVTEQERARLRRDAIGEAKDLAGLGKTVAETGKIQREASGADLQVGDGLQVARKQDIEPVQKALESNELMERKLDVLDKLRAKVGTFGLLDDADIDLYNNTVSSLAAETAKAQGASDMSARREVIEKFDRHKLNKGILARDLTDMFLQSDAEIRREMEIQKKANDVVIDQRTNRNREGARAQ